ncbi:MAG: glutamate 5-kinase [Cellvibrionaceae bacterium]
MNALSSKKNTRRWVIKIGSALLTDNGRGLDTEAIAIWVEQMAALAGEDIEFVLVSSGAVAAGMTRLGWDVRPNTIHELQAAAAVGQMGLVQTYEQCFQQYQRHTAQVLVVHDDLSDRQRYLNARSTLLTLLRLKVVPIVNENDTVVTDEIRFGDNDTLAALIANLVDADALVILTDQDGMYEEDPRKNPDATLLTEASVDDFRLSFMASDGGSLGRGGMITKVRAAKLAARSGANTMIVGGKIPDVLKRLAQGDKLGTLLKAGQQPQAARKLWLAGQLQTKGTLVLDDGAVKVLTEKGKSLLPVGVKSLKGEFRRGDTVICETQKGVEVARGLVNYSSHEAEKILGQPSDNIESILGYLDDEEMIHRDNLVLT